MALAVSCIDSYPQGMGTELGSDVIHTDIPFGLVQRFRYERGCVFWVYTTEHTDAEALEAVWAALPLGLSHYWQKDLRSVPPDFAGEAESCRVSSFATQRRSLLLGINKTQFFATQGVRLMQ